jgi:hypothetical protein
LPKQNFTISDFSGGTNGYIAPRDIADNEIVQCQGFKAEPGVVELLGDVKGSYTVASASGNMDIESGYGLFSFAHDYDSSAALANTNYLVMLNRISTDKHNKLDIHDGSSWSADAIDLGGSSANVRLASIKPNIYIADGSIRVSPGNFASVDSGEDESATLAINRVYGGVSTGTITGGTDYVAQGDTVIIDNKEFIVLRVNGTALYLGRNMTGKFVNATAAAQINVIPDTRWRGVIKRDMFGHSVGEVSEWYTTYAHPRPPATYNSNLDAGDGGGFPFMIKVYNEAEAATIDGTISPTLVVGYKEDEDSDDAVWDGASVNLYVTAMYDDAKQESQPNKAKSGIVIPAGKELAVWVGMNYSSDASTYQANKRVTGARIYYEDVTNEAGILYQLVEVDFVLGAKKADALSYTDWTSSAAGKSVGSPGTAGAAAASRTGSNAFIFAAPPKLFTYEINTGYPYDVNTHARYKTSTIANRRLFVANVYQSGKAKGDRMISSPVNRFDILPEYGDYIIDVTTGDGDEIIKLESYADRVLQFKKRTMYIINVGSGFGEEFLESTHKNMGVENPSQTCMTEYGVAWVNSKGVFLYDGQDITDLTKNKLQRSGSTRPKALNVSEGNVPLIGYYPDEKWLIILPESTPADDNDVEAWIHDFKNDAWTYSADFTTTDKYRTNMVWATDNSLMFGEAAAGATPNFYKYQAPTNNVASGKLLFMTKDFNLKSPGVKKKLKNIYVTYSASANTKIEADIIYTHETGEATVALQEKGGSTYYTEADGFLSTTGNTRTVKLEPSSSVSSVYTFQLKLHNPDATYPAGADFKLYDVQFVYRPRRI